MPTPTTSCSAPARPASGSSLRRGATPERGVKTHASFLALIGQAYRLLVARFAFYAAAVAAAIALQAAIAFGLRTVPHALDIAGYVVPPLLTTMVYAFVWNDARETPLPDRSAWERFLERAWAVIIIDLVFSFVAGAGIAGLVSDGVLGLAIGIVSTILGVLIVFADVVATVDDDVPVWSLIPQAFVKSVAAVVRPRVLPRAFALFALVILEFALQQSLSLALTNAHVPNVDFWSMVPLGTIVTPPLAALTAVVYRDATITVTRPRE